MKKIIYFLLPALVGMAGCQSSEPDVTQTTVETGITNTYDEIISRANLYYGMLPGRTRANAPAVSNVMPILIGETRSTEQEGETPIYYIVNYENEEGFVIVGGKDCAYPLLAISDEASLTEEDIDNIFPLKSFINNSSTLTSVVDTLYQEPEKAFNISISPKLHPNVRKWGQSAPFNSYTPLIDGKNAPLGCVPLAVGMLMSYYEWPTEHKGRNINWKIIKNGYCSALGTLLAELGDSSNLNTRYGLDGSATIFSNVPGTMKNYDYLTNRENIDLFDLPLHPNEECKEELKKYLPLIMCGKGYNKNDQKTGGHSWIIDGVLHIPYDPDNKLAPNNSPDAYFMHCVWGWYGRANGYYRIDGFGNLASDRHSKENSDTVYPGYTDEESNYVINQELWGYYGFKKKPIISGGVIVDPIQPTLP